MKKDYFLIRIFSVLILTLSFHSAFSQCQTSSTNSLPVDCNGNCSGQIVIFTNGGTQPYIVMHPVTSMPITYTSTALISNLCAGTYTLLINDATGNCQEVEVVTVTEPDPLNVTATPSPESTTGACDGSITGNVTGGVSPYTFTIDNFTTVQGSGTFNNLCAGTYDYCVMDDNGCISCTTIVVSTSNCGSMTSSVLQMAPASCYGLCDGAVSILTNGGQPPYVLNVNQGTFTYSSVVTVNNLCAGSHNGVVTDANGCTNPIIFTISQPAQINVSASGTAGAGCTGTLSSTVSGGTPGYTYMWVDCSNQNTIATTASVSNVCDGQYQFIVTDANGCTASSSCVTLNSGPCSLTASTQTQSNVSCYGDCDGLVLVYASGGTPPYSALVSNGMSIQFTSVGTLYPMCAGTFTITVTDNAGCTATTSATVSQPPQLVVTASGTAGANCTGFATASVTGGTGSVTYNWLDCSTGSPIGQNSITAQALCDGSYQVEATDANGCTATSSCVTLNSGPCNMTTMAQTQNNASCFGECDGLVILSTTGGSPIYTAVVSNGTTIQYTSFGTLPGLCAGTYTITVTDNAGCVNTVTATVTEPPAINIVTSSTNISAFGNCDGSVAGNASGGTGSFAFTWIDCTNSNIISTAPTASNLCAGSYALIVTDANGCSDTSACVTLGLPNNIHENGAANFSLYPNPARTQFTIDNPGGKAYTFEMLNMLGEVVYASSSAGSKTMIDLGANDIAGGAYVIRIKTAGGTSMHRLIVER